MNDLKKQKINALLTAVIIFVSVICVGVVYAPKLMGYQSYSIETGSMEPTIPRGSMVYVKPISDPSEYCVDDVVTFSANDEQGSFTHRIVRIDSEKRTFETQGDANADIDISPTPFEFAVGKVQFAIPLLGFIAGFLRKTVIKIAVAVIYIAWAAIEIEVFIAERKKRDE
ncbi:MAG: signal peptidase I [Clostridia bacterium]|nr:signal peptidase I [Clostridia bacterium]